MASPEGKLVSSASLKAKLVSLSPLMVGESVSLASSEGRQ